MTRRCWLVLIYIIISFAPGGCVRSRNGECDEVMESENLQAMGIEYALIREETGNVVLKAGRFQLRFDVRHGGTPLEFWFYGKPGPLTNSFAGAGTSICWDTGQDPTQASANGLLPNEIYHRDDQNSFDRIYYGRETTFDSQNLIYEISGAAPDWWGSLEWFDDYCAYGHENVWATPYRPLGLPLGADVRVPVAFKPNSLIKSSNFYVGNQMAPGTRREYGLFAGNALVALGFTSDRYAEGGIFFSDYRFVITRGGSWRFEKLGAAFFGGNKFLAGGKLTSEEKSLANGLWGLKIDVRRNNCDLGYFELRVGERLVSIVEDRNDPVGPGPAGVYGAAMNGYVLFGNREFFDMSQEYVVRFQALPDEVIRAQYVIRPAVCAPLSSRKFYRAGVGIWMNTQLPFNRGVGLFDLHGNFIHTEGNRNFLFRDYRGAWAGSIGDDVEDSWGVSATVIDSRVNGEQQLGGALGHFSVQQHGFGDSHVLIVSPLAPDKPHDATYLNWVVDYRCQRKSVPSN